MGTIYDFFVDWKDLIVGVYVEYPVAAAIVTILAIVAFFQLEKKWKSNKRIYNLFIVVGGWAILTPLVGLLMTVLGEIWNIIKTVIPPLFNLLSSFYSIYDKHPLMVITIIILGIVAYFVWKKKYPDFWRNKTIRIVAIIFSVILITFIISPIADLFNREKTEAIQEEVEEEKPADINSDSTPNIGEDELIIPKDTLEKKQIEDTSFVNLDSSEVK